MENGIKFNPALETALDGKATKAMWSEHIATTFALNRRMRFFHDPNPAAADPTATGTEIFNGSLIGTIGIAGGNVSGMGQLQSTSIRLDADLMTGTAAVLFESGTNWCKGTLGLSADAQILAGVPADQVKVYDFTLLENPSATTGMAIGTNFAILAPIWLASGTGPTAPPLTAKSIVAFRLLDYADEANPVSAGICPFPIRDPDRVMDHSWVAAEYGDVRVMRSAANSGLVLGTGGDAFRFAGSVLHQNAVTNSEANEPLQMVKIRAVPHGRWPGFPFRGGFVESYDTLIPGPHKIELLLADGTIAGVIESYSTRDAKNTPGSGRPVNYKDQSVSPRNGKRYQPFWTCHMVHEHWTAIPKFFSKWSHLIPGVTPDGMTPRNVTEVASQNQVCPMFTEQQQWNGLDCWSLAPKWGRTLAYASGFDTAIVSPYWALAQASRDDYVTQVIGYGFEPGSTSMHTWYMGPGGSRSDRAFFPSTIMAWASQPEGTRPHGAVPYKEMLFHWNMGYMNEGCHYFTDVEKGLGIDKRKILNGDVCYNDTYYRGTQENFRPDLANNAVRLLAATNKAANPLDKNGRHYTNAYSRDYMHTQSNAAKGAYTYISSSHVTEAAHSFAGHILATFQMSRGMPAENFLTRQHAWHMGQFVDMWIVGNNDPSGFTALEIEDMARRHLESTYDNVMPLYNSPTSIYGKSLRILGMSANQTDNTSTGKSNIGMITDSKAFYLGQVLMLWKQSGLFEVMKAKSQKCKDILDLIIVSLGKFSVDMFMDANGRLDQTGYSYYWPLGTEPQFTSWADLCPPAGQADWLRREDGSLTTRTIDEYNTMHFRGQFVHILRDYFPEYNFPRVNEAAAKVDAWYKIVADGSLDGTSWRFKYRFPMMGIMKKAAKVGAP